MASVKQSSFTQLMYSINSITEGYVLICMSASIYNNTYAGADPGFQVRGSALKKIAPSGGRRENFWGISCEKSRFYAKKSYFFQLRREARTFLGYFVWKITILCQKIIFFSNFRGGAHRVRPPPWIRPWYVKLVSEWANEWVSVV